MICQVGEIEYGSTSMWKEVKNSRSPLSSDLRVGSEEDLMEITGADLRNATLEVLREKREAR